jgi:hypothetical protein
MVDDYQIMHKCINRAVTLEKHKGQFYQALKRSLPGLHHSIHLPARDLPSHLTGFVIRYVQAVPKWLGQMESICHAGGLDMAPVRELIGRCFAEPPERHPDQVGLGAILDDAYLAHRVLEEINEHLYPLCGTPLLPMNPLVANLVVREMLGEEFACELDRISTQITQRFAGLSLSPESLVALVLCKQRFTDAPAEWQDFAEQLDIALRPPMRALQTDTIH